MHGRDHWIFDLDGTLTVAVHDFDGFKRDWGLPRDQPILEALSHEPPARARAIHAALRDWERGLAARARAAPGAHALLSALREADCRVAILTRNLRELALQSLAAAGLGEFLEPDGPEHRFLGPRFVLGREDAAPKPSPEGVQKILDLWGVPASRAWMIGDFRFDILAGKAAGVATAYVDRRGECVDRRGECVDRRGEPEASGGADVVVTDLAALRVFVP